MRALDSTQETIITVRDTALAGGAIANLTRLLPRGSALRVSRRTERRRQHEYGRKCNHGFREHRRISCFVVRRTVLVRVYPDRVDADGKSA